MASVLEKRVVLKMNKETFVNNFRLMLTHLDDLTRQFCINNLSTNYKFLLEPSDRNASNHLTETEKEYLKLWNRLENKQITFDNVVDLLYKDGKTPKWADCNVYYSTCDLTVIKIHFSRQFKDEKGIYYLERGTGPFKEFVATPYDYSQNGEKFDVNWKKNLDELKNRNLWTRIKQLIKSE